MTRSLYELFKLMFLVNTKEPCLEAYLIDWKKVKQILEAKQGTGVYAWELFLEIGWRFDRLRYFVDPAIWPIVKRLNEIGIVTFDSCSGHLDQENEQLLIDPSYPIMLSMSFRDQDFGKRFITKLEEVYQESELTFSFTDISSSAKAIGNSNAMIGPNFTWQDGLKYLLPISFNWEMVSDKPQELIKFWRIFSTVLDGFDQKGEHICEIDDFNYKSSNQVLPEWEKELNNIK